MSSAIYLLQVLSTTWMNLVDMSSMALQWHWPAISHMTTWEKTHHLWNWIFQRARLSSFLIIMPLCPTLMSMLVTSPCPPYLMAKADQCLVTVWIQGYLKKHGSSMCVRSYKEMRQNCQQHLLPTLGSSHTVSNQRILNQGQRLEFSQSSMKRQHRWQCRNMPCSWPKSHWFCKSWPGSSDCRWLSPLCIAEEMSVEVSWWSRWIEDGVLHGIPSCWDGITRMWKESSSWIWVGPYVLPSKSLHVWCHSLYSGW